MKQPTSTFRARDAIFAAVVGPLLVLGPIALSDSQGQPPTPIEIVVVLAAFSLLVFMLFATLRFAPRNGLVVLWLALTLLLLWPIVQFAYWPPLEIRQATHLLVPFRYWSIWAACLFSTAILYRWQVRNRTQWIRIALFGALWIGALAYSQRNVIASDVGVPSDTQYTTIGAVSLVLSLACPTLGAALLARDVDEPLNHDLTIHWS